MKKGLGYRVVMDLLEQYQGKGHCVYIDNFYTSPNYYLHDLLSRSTYCAGTVKSNRKGLCQGSCFEVYHTHTSY